MTSPLFSRVAGGAGIAAAFIAVFSGTSASAQVVVYETLRPVAPAIVAPPYVANYTPAGNYAAVTAFSPPVVATVPSSSVAVTSYYAPALAAAVPVTTFYAPAPAVVAAPVTAYYAPAAVAVPLYRRGLFGGYRPVRTAFYYPY
jgi:hypothetical protein